MKTSARSNCNTADFKKTAEIQQEPSSKILRKSDKIDDYQKTKHGFHKGVFWSTSSVFY